MTRIISDSSRAVTFPHAPWCDPSEHDDGSTHPTPDPDWQICFAARRTLEFGERDNAAANVEEICADLSFAHTDVWGERADVLVLLDVNGRDCLCLTPDQLAPIAHLLLAVDAEHRGETEQAEAFMTEALAGVVEIEVDTEREARREAARRAWQEKAAAKEAAAKAAGPSQREMVAKARHAAASILKLADTAEWSSLSEDEREKRICEQGMLAEVRANVGQSAPTPRYLELADRHREVLQRLAEAAQDDTAGGAE